MQIQISSRRKNSYRDTQVIKIRVINKFLVNNFALSDAEGNTTSLLNWWDIADLPLLRTLLAIHQKSWEPRFWEVMDSCFSSICMFGSFKNPFATITSLSELYFWFRRFVLLVQTKYEVWQQHKLLKTMKWRWVKFDLILMMRDKYINSNLNLLTKFTSSSRITNFKDIL